MEAPEDPVSVKSRTGYVIFVGFCPVSWVSTLQGLIALSTLESEYIALSTALWELIPLKTILQELCKNFNLKPFTFVTHTTVFEDNNGCLRLAMTQAMTPRTKHTANVYHWIRSHINKTITIVKVDTKLKIADIFTKPLPIEDFEPLRPMLCGW